MGLSWNTVVLVQRNRLSLSSKEEFQEEVRRLAYGGKEAREDVLLSGPVTQREGEGAARAAG